jgi:hypothetical protein
MMTTTHRMGAPDVGLTRCLFCRTRFPANGRLPHLPLGRSLAYDPEAGHLWVVCTTCHRWNLWPIEERDAALYDLERLVHDRGVLLAATAHVSRFDADGLSVVRVGAAALPERAWWRYGSELRRRRAATSGPAAAVSACTLGALAYLGGLVGLGDPEFSIDWRDAPVRDLLRWRRFGWAAWHGRERCPYCHSTLRALRYDLGWWVYPLRGPDGRLSVGVPCQRCDPWTPDKVYELHGDAAENVLRRLLAYQNIAGASERRIADAAREIERAGSPAAFARQVTDRRSSLWKLGPVGTIGLEIALGESAERRWLEMELRSLEALWRKEEELARIVDEELTPRRLLEAHLRKLPIRLRSRGAPGPGRAVPARESSAPPGACP